jgi:hypothetical protein
MIPSRATGAFHLCPNHRHLKTLLLSWFADFNCFHMYPVYPIGKELYRFLLKEVYSYIPFEEV